MIAIANVILTLFTVYKYALIVYIFLLWLPGAQDNPIGQFLTRICEPYLEPFRRIIPPIAMFDISPIVAILALQLAQSGLREIFIRFLG